MLRFVSFAVLLLCLLGSRFASAAVITVSSTCSFDNAIATLNAGSNVGGCFKQGTGSITINIPAGTFLLQAADLTIQRSVTIAGAGTSSTVVRATRLTDYAAALAVSSGSTVTMRNFTLQGSSGNGLTGLANFDGTATLTSVRITNFGTNGISNFSTMLLDRCTIDRNGSRNPFLGGGLNLQYSATTIDRTSITNNRAARGGGIFFYFPEVGTALRISRSLIANNNATEDGGGIHSVGQMDIDNTTVSGNSSALQGGGIFHDSGGDEFHLWYCTVAYNSAGGTGGGLGFGQVSTPAISYNIVANNTAAGGGPDISWNRLDSAGSYNLIGNASGWNAGAFPTGAPFSNKVGWNPQLGALQNQGGTTLVHPIPTTSPAFNAIPVAAGSGYTGDQRGFPRPRRGAYDMGAFEVQ
jgi:predicted outer membrane repeat protein